MKRKQFVKFGVLFFAIIFLLIAVIIIGRSVHLAKSNIENVKINLGSSEAYSQEELQAAADVILEEISSWNSVKKVYAISYCCDESTPDNENYCRGFISTEYVHCVVFDSSFKTSGSALSEGFNPDSVYDGWHWIVVKDENNEWKLLDWGY